MNSQTDISVADLSPITEEELDALSSNTGVTEDELAMEADETEDEHGQIS